jgi:hypothetical protein
VTEAGGPGVADRELSCMAMAEASACDVTDWYPDPTLLEKSWFEFEARLRNESNPRGLFNPTGRQLAVEVAVRGGFRHPGSERRNVTGRQLVVVVQVPDVLDDPGGVITEAARQITAKT